MTLELRAQVRRLAAEGYGWEDICWRLNIDHPWRLHGAEVRELTLLHVKHQQPEKGAVMR